MSALDFLVDELATLDLQGLKRRLRSMDGAQGPVVQLDGRSVINFSSNNYLGLADAPALREAATRSLTSEGLGSGASRLIVGNLRAHRQLEQALARFHELPAALLFNSGYQANVGLLSSLAGPGDVIFSDELNHASLIDGCRLSRAQIEVFAHRDVEALARRLVETPARRRFIVTDTLFSMDGDLAPLVELRALADRHGAALIIDEAHATGVLGPGGRGLAAALGVRPDVHVGTLSKALGAFGAYVAGSRSLIDYLANRARSFVFTTALPPSIAAAAEASLTCVLGGDALRRRLFELAERFASGLATLGYRVASPVVAPIFPVLVGDALRTMDVCEKLLELGIYAQGIRAPTVPRGTERLRFTLMATHEPAQIDAALAALRQVTPR